MRTLAVTVLLLTFTVCKQAAAQSGMPEELRELLKEALSEVAGVDADAFEQDHSTSTQHRVAVPQFMLDMYDCWNTIEDANETNVLRNCHRAIVDEEEEELPRIVQEADTILTFLHEDSPKRHPLDAASMKSIGDHVSLQFVSKCQQQKPISAEFRIHKRVTNMETLPEQCRRSIENEGLTVKLWISDEQEHKGNKTVEFVRHVRTQQVVLLGQQWVLFKSLQDVTGEWYQNSSQCGQRKSLYITLGQGCTGMDPALLGFNTGNTTGAKEQPFFSIFNKDEARPSTHSVLGEDLQVNITELFMRQQERQRRDALSAEYAQYLQERLQEEMGEQKKNSCQSYDFKIENSDIGWEDVVVIPSNGFTTKYCLGHCLFPLDTNRDSFHAVIQAIANIHRPDEVPPPCCAPKTLSSLVVLMHTEENTLQLRKVPGLIVEECACL